MALLYVSIPIMILAVAIAVMPLVAAILHESRLQAAPRTVDPSFGPGLMEEVAAGMVR